VLGCLVCCGVSSCGVTVCVRHWRYCGWWRIGFDAVAVCAEKGNSEIKTISYVRFIIIYYDVTHT